MNKTIKPPGKGKRCGSHSEAIAHINDGVRKAISPLGTSMAIASSIPARLMITRTVANLPHDHFLELMEAVRGCDVFDVDNDPYGERDFGAVTISGEKYFWKFDYYNKDLSAGSDDPWDTDKTVRVLTIMHASEY